MLARVRAHALLCGRWRATRLLQVGSVSASLDALLRRHRQSTWAFITAWNPSSILLSRAENDERQAELRRDVGDEGYATLPGEGFGQDPASKAEESLLVMDIRKSLRFASGRRFGQLAIVVGRRGSRSRLVPCREPPPVIGKRQRRPFRSTT